MIPHVRCLGQSGSTTTNTSVPDYMLRAGSVYRVITDHLGSVRLVVDTATGAVVQQLNYDEWGVSTAVSGTGFQPFGFAGGMADEDSGALRFGARDLLPELGRWLEKDPVLFAGGSGNLYTYVLADPVNLVDPLGLCMIQVRYRPILSDLNPGIGYHSYILLTEPNGDRTAFTATRGGPVPTDRCDEDGYGPFGSIEAHVVPYVEGATNDFRANDFFVPSDILMPQNGASCEPYINRLRQVAAGINSQMYPYLVFTQNSNSVTRTGLLALGGDVRPTWQAWIPVLGRPVPGWGNPLRW